MWKLRLFGTPRLERAGRHRHISRRKARALLAYLAVTQQTQSRETLVTLLWPEHGYSTGRADLSRMLSVLRRAIGAEYVRSDRDSVALNAEQGLWVDVVQFREQLGAYRDDTKEDAEKGELRSLTTAVEIYREDFLAGFTLPDCEEFDEWQLLQTESLRRELGWTLSELVRAHERLAQLDRAIAFARRWLSLDPLNEAAHRRLIALYGRNGQRAQAERQYRACEHLLTEELGVNPEPTTQLLIEQIRSGVLLDSALDGTAFGQPTSMTIPKLDWDEGQAEPDFPFVARTDELSILDGHLAEALAGNGRIVFVTGGAGRGKTSLLTEFSRRAMETYPDLVAASGKGSAFAGVGDPYLPFREVMEVLTGGVEIQMHGERLGAEHARRLRMLVPRIAKAIVDYGPQLLDVLVATRPFLGRVTAVSPEELGLLTSLRSEISRREGAPGSVLQSALFGQFTNVLRHLSGAHPLLLSLDDLHWLDEGSIGLLFHLGRRLTGSRILVVGAYRPEDLPRGEQGQPHPLSEIAGEFGQIYGGIVLDLANSGRSQGMEFVEALVDSEPNRLDADFRRDLFRRTGGHPLFTVELLREMRSRGHLIPDDEGSWIEGKELDWGLFPARVEAVIARRVDRLDDNLRDILAVASVEGERFTPEVVASVSGIEERRLLRILSGQLEDQNRLLRELVEVRARKGPHPSFQFRHALFQQFIYRQLSSAERRQLHIEVAEALEALGVKDLDRDVVQVAQHYVAADDWPRAIPHLIRAGDLAFEKASLPDAVRHYRSAVVHLPVGEIQDRAQTMLKLGECLWMLGEQSEAVKTLQSSFDLMHKLGNIEGASTAQRLLGRAYWELGQGQMAAYSFRQALAIAERESESEVLAWAMAGMSNHHMQMGEYDESVDLGRQALAIARRVGAVALIIQCLCDLGSALSGKGDWSGLEMEHESLELALASNRPHDAGRAYLYFSEGLLYLGEYEQTRRVLNEAMDYTERMQIPYISTAASSMLTEVDWLTGRWSEALAALLPADDEPGTEPHSTRSLVYRRILLARAFSDLGRAETAKAHLTESGMPEFESLDLRAPLLGELIRSEAIIGNLAASEALATELLELTGQSRYLYPNVNMGFLSVCYLTALNHRAEMMERARTSLYELERLDRQYGTQVTAASRLEAEGWLRLADGEIEKSTTAFDGAVGRWEKLGHPYDRARALSGFGQAAIQAGDKRGANAAMEQAMALVNGLANQLELPDLKGSFLDSPLVHQIHEGLHRTGNNSL